MYVGKSIATSNSDVNQLPVGSTLQVTAKGTLKVTFVAPIPVVFNPGDRVFVRSKARYGRIFRATTNGSAGVSGQPPKGYQFYVSDDAPYVIREAAESDLQKL